ncbi:hypothetical protein GGR50DRAFT_265396 [Xylaria sp. CBS 124048]|nr:hypothetical protein GGR50DRAFT_265396 [Xylaria sp. CBS 124048]
MPTDVCFDSKVSPDSTLDNGLTDPDEFSSDSDVIHIGIPLRPQMPGIPAREPHRRDGWNGPMAQPLSFHDGRRYDKHGDGFSRPLHERGESGTDEAYEPDHALNLAKLYARLKTQRQHVRRSWQSKDEAERKFMAAARALVAENPELRHLHQLYSDMQNTHMGHQVAEKDLEEITDELERFHEDFDSDEGSFYATALDVAETTPPKVKDQESHPDTCGEITLSGISGDRPENHHPLYERLCEAFGELQLARELLTNTRLKREALQASKSLPLSEDSLTLMETHSEAAKNKVLEMKAMAEITEDDYEQLQEYDELEQSAMRDIEFYTQRVNYFARACEENDISPPSFVFYQQVFGIDSFFRDEIWLSPDGDDDSAVLAHRRFPLLVRSPTHVLHNFPLTALQSLRWAVQLPRDAPTRAKQISEAAREANMETLLSTIESEDKNEFINRWLLHKLYSSVMEVELLWTTVQAKLNVLDKESWQQHVLHFWWQDNPISPALEAIANSESARSMEFLNVDAKVGMRYYNSYFKQLESLRHWDSDELQSEPGHSDFHSKSVNNSCCRSLPPV